MTSILGISGLYHDSAACVVVDGHVRAAVQEERFTRRKHDAAFPVNAIRWCLEDSGIDPEAIDYVAFYEKPLLKFDRLLHSFVDTVPAGLSTFLKAVPSWLNQKLHVRRLVERTLQTSLKRRVVYTRHHLSHAASAFYTSPFETAAIVTVDGVGEWTTSSVGVGNGNTIRLLQEQRFPHSLGLLYSAFTAFCGFRVNGGEYKLMGLAPLGQPVYVDRILEQLVDLKPNGSFQANMKYFAWRSGSRMTTRLFDRLFDGPPRSPASEITRRERDLAASIQSVIEAILLRMIRHAHDVTGQQNLCMAGGVALNCVANSYLLRDGPFDDLWIPPAPGDAGGAVGAALFVWHQLLEESRVPHEGSPLCRTHAMLGPSYTDAEITTVLSQSGVSFESFDDDDSLCEEVAGLIAAGNVVGWFQGRAEFGPRALGNRSILADPRCPDMQDRINSVVKRRESFRPFAPAVTAESAHRYFDLPVNRAGIDAAISRYMLLTGKAKDKSLPAVTHCDGSARVQIVDADDSPYLHRLLKSFEAISGVPVLLNTSFNVRGEPIVQTPDDALRCFHQTSMDTLVVGHQIVRKQTPDSRRAGEAFHG